MPIDLDWRLRLAAFAALERLRQQNDGVVTGGQLTDGFEFEGEQIRLFDPRRGIWRPRQLGRQGAALSLVTAPPKAGKKPPYDDQIASDEGMLLYKYERRDPALWTNVAVRRAMVEQRPIIYLYGVVPNIYEPVFPCYVVDDRPDDLTFGIVADAPGVVVRPDLDESLAAPRREYATAAVKVRLHQSRFRALVLSAYQNRCTVCRLKRPILLDAAHILPDRDERGRPEVPNGLALCKIHHAAYDANIIGVDPQHMVHVRRDVLEEHDGPMLRHGLQEMEGTRILLPRSVGKRPREQYLEERFERFRAA